jgi:hypothetical protein
MGIRVTATATSASKQMQVLLTWQMQTTVQQPKMACRGDVAHPEQRNGRKRRSEGVYRCSGSAFLLSPLKAALGRITSRRSFCFKE